MSGRDFEDFGALQHHHLMRNILLFFTSTFLILFFVVLEVVLADRLAAYCCGQYTDSRLSRMSQLSRDLEAQFRQVLARQVVGAREETYLGLQGVLFEGENSCEEAIVLAPREATEEERLQGYQELFIVGEE